MKYKQKRAARKLLDKLYMTRDASATVYINSRAPGRPYEDSDAAARDSERAKAAKDLHNLADSLIDDLLDVLL